MTERISLAEMNRRRDDEKLDKRFNALDARLRKVERLGYIAIGGLCVIGWLMQHFASEIGKVLMR